MAVRQMFHLLLSFTWYLNFHFNSLRSWWKTRKLKWENILRAPSHKTLNVKVFPFHLNSSFFRCNQCGDTFGMSTYPCYDAMLQKYRKCHPLDKNQAKVCRFSLFTESGKFFLFKHCSSEYLRFMLSYYHSRVILGLRKQFIEWDHIKKFFLTNTTKIQLN